MLQTRSAVLLAVLVAAATAAPAEDAALYSSKYDSVDLDKVLASDRLLNSYFQCLIADADDRCTADAKYLKEVIPDALTNECNRCRPNQKEGAEKVIKFLINNKPDMWEKLEAKYDPQGVYKKRYQNEFERVKGGKDQEPYSSKYDNVNLDEVLASERLLNSYFECLIANTEERCTADAKYLKEVIPDALTNGCSRCRPNQREGADKVIKFLIKNKPDMWNKLEAKYDPEGVYRKKYQKEYEMAKREGNNEPYSSKYDNVNLDEVLASERLLNSYFECLMANTEERCTADAKYLKEVIPDALTNGCSRCKPNQREGAEKVIRFLVKNKPDMWNKLEAKYDPEGIYKKSYQSEFERVKGGKDQEPYSSKYDNVNLDEVLASERLLNNYFECLIADTEERCTADAKYLKEVIPDALTNGCSRCRPNQRDGADKVIRFLIKNKPDMWKKLEAKYDPEGVYGKKYQSEYERVKRGEAPIERSKTSQDNEPYSSKYDNVNLDEVLKSDRLLSNYFQCLMDENEERCTADAKYLKEVIPDALNNGCSRCRPNQREGAEKVIKYLMKNKPDMWNKLEAKYDPDGTYRKKYQNEYDMAKSGQDNEPYSSKYDNVNLDEVLASERLLNNYFECLMADTEDRCTADAKYLKEVIPDALTNGCSRCRPNQREGAEKVIKHLMKNKPDMWNKLEAKYDPDGTYRKKYQNEYDMAKSGQDNEPYSSKYDNVNLDEVLASERLLNSYFECLIADTDDRCTAEAKYLKEVIPDALKNGCSRCRPNQREGAEKVIKHLINKKPDMWNKLEAKYDPEGVYSKKYQSDYERVKGQKEADMYSSKYDNVNLDEVLRSDRLLDSYFRCLIENTEDHCTADAKYLKEVIPDALTNGCNRCRPNQRDGAEKVIRHLIKNKPAMWNELEAKYDPEGIYRAKYQKDYERVKV
ncbi:uncharacterized protein LOC126191109 [Schistocerca cancellata]|uniref:uncharacterized protein LOC126191109 n=1 Tax=Schistocerca cancellata TaxID=274614 RepID=UPI002117C730|nr:uncharacterized protein LOC126191109 [Schistocerca cancellata]